MDILDTNEKYILIIDDVIDNLHLLSNMLREHDYKVRCATSGKLALQAVLFNLPDLILLDIQMPEMDGFEVCQKLKQNPKTEGIPVIFLSASDNIDSKVKGFEVGGVDYVTKPFQIKEVLIRVKNQLLLQSANLKIKQLNQVLQEQFAKEKSRTKELEDITYKLQGEISRRQEAEKQLLFDASHDGLTGLPNRKLLMERIDNAVNLIQKNQNYEFALLFLDLNNFKNVNDTLGHAVGDQLLTTFGNLLFINVREMDTVARLGGDEFVILLDGISSRKDVIDRVDCILAELKVPIYLNSNHFSISTSIGVAFSSPEYTSSSQILRDADIAMYHAKKQGENQCVIFDQSMDLKLKENSSVC